MLFNSFTFAFFFAATLAIYFALPRWRQRKVWLLLASYIFYAAWNPPLVCLLWLSTVVDWYCAGRMAGSSTGQRRLLLMLSLLCNLGLLAFFKYANFLATSFADAVNWFGGSYSAPEWSIVLPIGISFYTFQSMSYTIDVYRRRIDAGKSFVDFALYVTFFPQLVAGPIVRSGEFLPQCETRRQTSSRMLGWGLSLLILGVFQKTIADNFLAPVADEVYSIAAVPVWSTVWIGTLAFAGQIYFDFAGYSTCAIGVAMCFGFALPDNFRNPYAARGFSDFWRRWHISLSTWLRDYLYIPLGGSRHGVARTGLALMITMLLGGLWHGASWTFAVWGAVHGLLLVIERLLRTTPLASLPLWQRPVGKVQLQLLTFAVICWTWILFRANDFQQAWHFTIGMVSLASPAARTSLASYDQVSVLSIVACIFCWQAAMRDRTLESLVDRMPAWATAGWLTFMLIVIALSPGGDRAFIYFQF